MTSISWGGRRLLKTVLAVLILASQSHSAHGENGHHIYLTSGEWPPLISQSLTENGVLSKIVKEAFKLQGISVSIDYYPWARSYRYLTTTEDFTYSGSLGYVWTEARDKEMYFSEPIYEGIGVFFHLVEANFDWKEYSHLKGLSIGTTIGYQYGPDFEKARREKLFDNTEVTSDLINFRKLLNNRIDLFPTNIDVGLYILKKNFSVAERKRITYHSKPYHLSPIYAIFPKSRSQSNRLLNKFNKGLEQLKTSGQFDQIIKSHRGEFHR